MHIGCHTMESVCSMEIASNSMLPARIIVSKPSTEKLYMKRFLILSASLGLSLSLSAQQNDTFPTDYECLYEYTIQAKDGVKESYSTILQIGTACAYFTDYTSYQLDSVRCTPSPDEKTLLHYGQRILYNEFYFDQSVL